jgi:hypothetical protein
MPLTADDARDIADAFQSAYEAIDRYLDDNWQSISRSDYDTVNEAGKTLLRNSASMRTEAVGLSIDQMADASAELKQVIGDAKESLTRLETIGAVIRVTAGLADLAKGILERNPGKIFNASQGIQGIISNPTTPPPDF